MATTDDGRTGPGDPGSDRGYYERLAQDGDAEGMYGLGWLAEQDGSGSAIAWYEKAADLGHVEAQRSLAHLTKGTQPKKARALLERLAESGDSAAMGELADMLKDEDPGTARGWCEKAIALGDAGPLHLAKFLGTTGLVRALALWGEVANNGVGPAMYALGYALEPVDRGEAWRWFERAASPGQSPEVASAALMRLGHMCTRRRLGSGKAYFERAAALGNTTAMRILGTNAMRSDMDEAQRWLEQAVSMGDLSTGFPLRLVRLAHGEGFFATAGHVCLQGFLQATDIVLWRIFVPLHYVNRRRKAVPAGPMDHPTPA